MYSGYGITFDSAGFWSFDNGTAGNVVIIVVDNSSSSHTGNRKNNFLILGVKVQLLLLKEALIHQRKNINFSELNTKLCLILHYNVGNSYLFVNGQEICKFKVGNKNFNLPPLFCLRSISHGFSATESIEVSLNGNVYDFSVDYNAIDKSHILKKFLII